MLIILSLFIFLIALTNTLFWQKPKRASASLKLSVLIPARNEALNLENCVLSVLKSPETLKEILILDDHSTDSTLKIAHSLALAHPVIRVIQGKDLPSDWTGKNYACFQLATESSGDYLLFLDADTRLKPLALNYFLGEIAHRKLSLLSFWPQLSALSFWEKILMPFLNFAVFTIFLTPLASRLNRPSLALAHGACILVSRKDYFSLGGHSIVKSELFEDTLLARAFRAKGFQTLCLDGYGLVSVRMYQGLSEILNGFQKNFYPAFRHTLSFFGFLFFYSLIFIVTLLALFGLSLEFRLSLVLFLLARISLAIRFKEALWSIFFFPFGILAVIIVGSTSFYKIKLGSGVIWKGRTYEK